jgi:hypothetical protein
MRVFNQSALRADRPSDGVSCFAACDRNHTRLFAYAADLCGKGSPNVTPLTVYAVHMLVGPPLGMLVRTWACDV